MRTGVSLVNVCVSTVYLPTVRNYQVRTCTSVKA
jgi:hypothetical protein